MRKVTIKTSFVLEPLPRRPCHYIDLFKTQLRFGACGPYDQFRQGTLKRLEADTELIG
jgi:hypothetical protein